MNTNRDPRELVVDLLPRSGCTVQCAAVIADHHGIFSWGINHMGFTGFGMHAECDAIRRSNRRRLRGSTIYVAGGYRGRVKMVTSKPCFACQKLINKWDLNVVYRDNVGRWILN